MRSGSCGCDRIHGTHVHAGSHDTECNSRIAIHHDLRFLDACSRDIKGKIEIFANPVIPSLQQIEVVIDDLLTFFGKRKADLFARQVDVEMIKAAHHAERKHVFAALRIADIFQAFLFHRNFINIKALCNQLIIRFRVGFRDSSICIGAPFVFQQNDCAFFDVFRFDAADQHLLVERHHQIGIVTSVGDAEGADTDAVTAGAGLAARRWFDLSGDDFNSPDAFAHFSGDGAEGLRGFLRTLAGVAEDLNDVLPAGYKLLLPFARCGILVCYSCSRHDAGPFFNK